MEKIRYLLILVNGEPRGEEEYFIGQLLDSLYSEGKPYRAYVDKQTKVALQVVRTKYFDERLISTSAVVSFGRIWNYKLNLNDITYQPFFGKGVSGAAVTLCESEKEPSGK